MIGIDEVGRGCWAGPLLVVAARQCGSLPAGLTDSKLLSRSQREEILDLLSICCEFGNGWVEALEIDRLGLAEALRLGVQRALSDLKVLESEEVLLDGSVNYINSKYKYGRCEIDADLNVPIVSAASIHAKVTRDNLMRSLAKKYPDYGFENHVGYGTKFHRSAIVQLGALEGVHRYSFKPIQALVR
jgi:ribonuclease HII